MTAAPSAELERQRQEEAQEYVRSLIAYVQSPAWQEQRRKVFERCREITDDPKGDGGR